MVGIWLGWPNCLVTSSTHVHDAEAVRAVSVSNGSRNSLPRHDGWSLLKHARVAIRIPEPFKLGAVPHQ